MLGWGIWHYMREVGRVELETTQFFAEPCGSKTAPTKFVQYYKVWYFSIECPHHLFQTWHLVQPQQTVTGSSQRIIISKITYKEQFLYSDWLKTCQLITNKCNFTSVTECKMVSLKMIDSLDKSKLRQTKWCPNIKWKLIV